MASTNLAGTPISKAQFFNFSGGLNTKDNEMTLDVTEASDILNIDLGDRGTFKQRGGLVPVVDGSWSMDEEKEVWTMYQFTRRMSDEMFRIMVYTDGTWQINGVNVRLLDTENTEIIDEFVFEKKPSFFHYNDMLYVVNTGKGVFKFPTELAETSEVVATIVPTLPEVRHAIIHNNRAFYTDSVQLDRIFWSMLNDVENLDDAISNAYGEDSTLNAGGVLDVHSKETPITGFAVFLSALLIFKKDAIYSLTGYTPDLDWQMSRLNIATGCCCDNMIAVANNCVYYLGEDGVYRLTTPYENYIETKPISDKITPTILQKRKDMFQFHDILFTKNRLYLLFNTDIFVYYETLGAWTVYNMEVNNFHFDYERDAMLFGGKSGYVLEVDESAANDYYLPIDATPIHCNYITGFNSLGVPEVTKKYKWLKLFFKPIMKRDSTIDVRLYIGNKDTTKTVDQTFNNLKWGVTKWGKGKWGTKVDQMDKMVRFGGSEEYIKFQFTNDKLDETMHINGFTLGFKTKKKVR